MLLQVLALLVVDRARGESRLLGADWLEFLLICVAFSPRLVQTGVFTVIGDVVERKFRGLDGRKPVSSSSCRERE